MRYNIGMTYHKTNLKERLTQIAWDICNEQSWKHVNMRAIGNIAGVSSTAIYRHFTSKNDLKAALMVRGYQLLSQGVSLKTSNDFADYGAQYVRFGLRYPYIYDLMFADTDIDVSQHPTLQAISNEAWDEVVDGIKRNLSDLPETEILMIAYNTWARVHGLVGILRRPNLCGDESETLTWIENNLEEYLKKTRNVDFTA